MDPKVMEYCHRLGMLPKVSEFNRPDIDQVLSRKFSARSWAPSTIEDIVWHLHRWLITDPTFHYSRTMTALLRRVKGNYSPNRR